MSNDTPDDAAALTTDQLLAALEAEVVDLRTREAQVAREQAANALERTGTTRSAQAGGTGVTSLEQRCVALEHERDELRKDRDAVLRRLDGVTAALTAREAEWAAASAGMDEERARWVAEEADYARRRDEDRARLERAQRFSPRHRLGVLMHRLRG